jgi:primosomal protein N' (replication factor Y)
MCKNCGYVFKCPHCEVSYIYHKSKDNLRCHYCGRAINKPDTCPNCHNDHLSLTGSGTEKIEEELESLFPELKIVRMDLDTTSRKGSHERIIKDFADHKYDILLGTQMIAKGLDFPNVTLVGVINADTSLFIPSYKSPERTFALLSQVAGRSGRGDREGMVIIQTFNVDHYAINLACSNNYISFYNEEMKNRLVSKYPPYYYLCNIRISGKDTNYLLNEANKIKRSLERNLTSTIILGPSNASIFKMNNTYRYNILLKYKKDDLLIPLLNKILEHYKTNSKVKIDIDFNPSQML